MCGLIRPELPPRHFSRVPISALSGVSYDLLQLISSLLFSQKVQFATVQEYVSSLNYPPTQKQRIHSLGLSSSRDLLSRVPASQYVACRSPSPAPLGQVALRYIVHMHDCRHNMGLAHSIYVIPSKGCKLTGLQPGTCWVPSLHNQSGLLTVGTTQYLVQYIPPPSPNYSFYCNPTWPMTMPVAVDRQCRQSHTQDLFQIALNLSKFHAKIHYKGQEARWSILVG